MEPKIPPAQPIQSQTPLNKQTNNINSYKQKYFLIGLPILLALIILGGISYYLGEANMHPANKRNTNIPKQIIIPSSTPTPIFAPVDTSNWKVYKNTMYNFQIKYPEYFAYYDGRTEIDFYPASPSAINNTAGPLGPRISILWRGIGTPSRAATSELFDQTQNKIEFNNVYGVQIGNNFDYYLTDKSGNEPVFRIYFQNFPQSIDQEQMDKLLVIFKQILSTLTFTN